MKLPVEAYEDTTNSITIRDADDSYVCELIDAEGDETTDDMREDAATIVSALNRLQVLPRH